MQSTYSVALTGFDEAESSSKLVLLKPIKRLAKIETTKLAIVVQLKLQYF